MKSYAVITVLDNLSETSMPWNEFVLYRVKHNPELKQYVIVCDSGNRNISVPKDLNIYYTGFNVKKVRHAMREIVSECKNNGWMYVIHMHQSKSAAFFNLSTMCCGYKKKTLFTIHSQFPAYNIQNKIASFYNALSAKRITNVSKTSYDVYPKIIKVIKGKRMSYIANGVDIDRINYVLSNQTVEKTGPLRFIYVARMIPLKKHEFLVEVFHEIEAPYELIFVGAEDSYGNIRKQVNQYNMTDKVTMTGLIPRDELFKILAYSDVYVSSSTIEGLPVSVLEAMTAKLPAIISDIPPHREIADLCDEVEVLPFDKEKWKKTILRKIKSGRQALQVDGEKCRNAVEKYFSLSSMHKKYYEEYEKLI